MAASLEEEGQDQPAIPLQRFQPLHLIQNTPKGRGVFAAQPIPSGTILDTSPVLLLSPQETNSHIRHTVLNHYTYNWPCPSPFQPQTSHTKPQTTQAVVFGLGSMFNHSTLHQNVGWKRDLDAKVIVYRALRDIQQGEELCISYGEQEHLTFRDVEVEEERRRKLEEESEDPGAVLARIGLGDDDEDEDEGPEKRR